VNYLLETPAAIRLFSGGWLQAPKRRHALLARLPLRREALARVLARGVTAAGGSSRAY